MKVVQGLPPPQRVTRPSLLSAHYRTVQEHMFVWRAALVVVAVQASCPAIPTAVSTSGSWVLTFEDNFPGTTLNASNWTPSNYSDIVSKYDGHDALFTADMVSVSDGNLVITTSMQTNTWDGTTYNFTSGWVDSQLKRNQTKGRFEASIKMPSNESTGAWPAWWLLPEGECWPISTELDIVEYYVGRGHNQHSRPSYPAQMSSSYHYGYGCGDDLYHYPNDTVWWPSGNWTPSPSDPTIDFSADFHTFGVEINDTAIRFYVDSANNTIMTKVLPPLCLTEPGFTWGKSEYMPFKPLYGILNVAMMGEVEGENKTWWKTHNATTLFDWVRFYEWVPSDVAVPVSP